MNYARIYYDIIENRQKNPITEGYSENHHIKPKSLGGQNNLDNLVRLSAREHFICHYLLAKIYKKETFEWYKMNHAFMMMKCDSVYNDRYFNSRLYEALKGDFSSVMSFAQKGNKNSQHGTCWICLVKDKENKKIPKQDLELWETKGWVKGRSVWKQKPKRDLELEIKEKVLLYTKIYEESNEFGLLYVCEKYNKGKTPENLIMKMKKYAKDYVSQRGIKRGNCAALT